MRWLWRITWVTTTVILIVILAYRFINPPTTAYILSEGLRTGEIRREWRDFDSISAEMPRAIVAAEDANFCNHWGFDVEAIRDALEDGAARGASTLTQQTVKNVFLWHGRSWLRKALEALLTPAVELLWPKKRILEVYMNIAEFDEGVFGVDAAARWYFGVDAKNLNSRQAALLAAILPDPKARSAKRPSQFVAKRAGQIQDGSATILLDGRSACFDT